jgi:hypothetical protein
MGMASGFTNDFTSGEICDEAWDRVDIQPVGHGCELAQNLVVRIAGPLAKRRGFWFNGPVYDQTKAARIIPFRKSVTDALMLEFGDSICNVWQANGQPLLNGGVQVSFATPYTAAQLASLRHKQVGDVIYFRTSDGQPAQSLTRTSNIAWAFAAETFPNGPWLAENLGVVTISVTGTSEADNTIYTNAGSILAGQAVTLVASAPLFDPLHVGGYWRLRATDGAPGVASWQPGYQPSVGSYRLSAGHVYRCSFQSVGSGNTANVSTPPVHTSGSQSDGGNIWDYRHDGAGVILITGYTDSQHLTGTVINTVPLISGQATTRWAEGAYSPFRGWPRAWPEMVEERLVNGATAKNLDWLDLTSTAGFTPTSETYSPGLGTGQVTAVDALRRRLGDDSAEIMWARLATFLIIGTASGEYVVSGGLIGSPLAAATIIIRQISEHGSFDAYPAKAHKGLFYVTASGQQLRSVSLDQQQSDSGDDLSVLARHIGKRGFRQLAWIKGPDETLWCRMADGGLACLVYHAEQQVRGWVTATLPTGWVCEYIAALPGPGGFETLWCVWSRVKAGVTQRVIVMQSQESDNLFMDLAQAYAGAGVAAIGGLAMFEGETITANANGGQQPDGPVTGGAITVPAGTTAAQVGVRYTAYFRSLKLDLTTAGGTVGKRERVASVIISMKCAQARVGMEGGLLEQVSTRAQGDVPVIVAKRTIEETNIAGSDTQKGRDPRLTIQDSSVYDCVIYSLRPNVVVGG